MTDHDELVAILMAAPDSDWAKMPDLLEDERAIVAKVRAGIEHDGDCTKQSYTCLRCQVEEYDQEARFVAEQLRPLIEKLIADERTACAAIAREFCQIGDSDILREGDARRIYERILARGEVTR